MAEERSDVNRAIVLALEGLIVGLQNLPLIIQALHQANYIDAATKEQLFAKLHQQLDQAKGYLISWEEAIEQAREDIYGPESDDAG